MIKKLMIYSFLLIGLNAQLNAGDETPVDQKLQLLTTMNDQRLRQLNGRYYHLCDLNTQGWWLSMVYPLDGNMCFLFDEKSLRNCPLGEKREMARMSSLDEFEKYLNETEELIQKSLQKQEQERAKKKLYVDKRLAEFKKTASESGRISPVSGALSDELVKVRSEKHKLFIDFICSFDSQERQEILKKTLSSELQANKRLTGLVVSASLGGIETRCEKEAFSESGRMSPVSQDLISKRNRVVRENDTLYTSLIRSFPVGKRRSILNNTILKESQLHERLKSLAADASAGCGDGPGEE